MKLQNQSFDNVAPLKHAGCSGDFLRRCFLPARPRAQVLLMAGLLLNKLNTYGVEIGANGIRGETANCILSVLVPSRGAFTIRPSGPRDLF